MLEKVFSRIMQHDIRLETLEFNAESITNPSLNERLFDIKLRLDKIEDQLNKEIPCQN